jgi:hypothetical protein
LIGEITIPIHPFDFSPKNLDAGVRPEPTPVMPAHVPNQPNFNRTTAIDYDPINVATEDVDSVFPDGYETMDRGMKEFFSNIDVPTKDGTRKLDVRIAGGDKTILFWKQLMDEDARIKLPVMSINRQSFAKINPQRHTPASVGPYFYRRFADNDKTRMILSPREKSVFIDYTLSVWAERKRDMERIVYQVETRFNPLAQWTVEDEFMRGDITAKLENITDNSDIDIDANQLAKVRYDFTVQVEGWMPLSGRVVPTVLGRVQSLAELDTREFFETIKFNARG